MHKGNELNNVRETWNRNEERQEKNNAAGTPLNTSDTGGTVSDDLQQTIKDEASEYDKANKEDRVLGGSRASVNDEEG